MINKEIKKKKISPLIKTNQALNNPKYKKTIVKKKEEQKIQKKVMKKKSRAHSISAACKGEPKKEQLNLSNSFNNSLELDYLNFSQMDLFKLNDSFEEDIFTPNYNQNNKNKKKEILNRYEDSNSTITDYSNIIINKEFDNIENTIKKNYLLNTPSTICNYYEQSSNKQKNSNEKHFFKEAIPNESIKKNLAIFYNENNLNDIKDVEKNDNNLIKTKSNLKEKYSSKDNKINMMNTAVFNDNLIRYKKSKNEEINNKNINNFYSNYSKNKKLNESKKNNANDNIATIDYKLIDNKINVNNILNEKTKLRKGSQDKQINIYNNQNKNDPYYITPRNNKIKKETSTKSTKINTKSIGKAKSFSSKKVNKTKYLNSNLIYLNKNKINDKITNYKILKDLIKDNKEILHNQKQLNKTTSKYKNLKIVKNNSNDIIKVNLKNKTKSSSNLNAFQKKKTKEENRIFNAINNNINNINDKLKSEIKNSFTIYQNIYKTINKSGIKSPDKYDNTLFKISKTLTENNIIHKIQGTPKNYKIQKFDSIPFTTIVKKIFIGSSQKDNLIKFDSSMKKKGKTKTEQMKMIFKPKTQSDFKPYNNIVGSEFFKKSGNNGLNCEYGNDKHVKQKLLDRMNKATNNWNYIFKNNKNKKVLDDGISNLKSQNKEYYNNFYKNENIISDGSEKEDEDNDK